MTFVVERRMANASTADLALFHEALTFAWGRLTSRGEPVLRIDADSPAQPTQRAS